VIRDSSGRFRNLTIFSGAALAIGWIGHGVDVMMGTASGDSLGILLWLVLPTTTGLLLRAFAGDGWSDAGFRFNIRGNAVWYGFALAIYPVLTMLALAIGGVLGQISWPGLTVRTGGQIAQAFGAGALPQLLKNVFEESAWRGYLAPKVHALGMTGYSGHVIVGVIWGLWHVPYYLFFLDRSILRDFTTLPLAAFIAQAIIVMVAWAVVYGELWLLTRSIWPAVLMHAVEDAFLNQLFTGKHITITPGSDWLVSPVHGLISVALFLAVGVALHRHRTRPA
jgi:membrane protease YdiL (CAAX protease family)